MPDLFDTPNREYHPTQGRWIRPDLAGLNAVDPSNPQSWNRYAYVLNNPLSYVDPTGLYCAYLNDAGTRAVEIDDDGDQAGCGSNGGYWISGSYGAGSWMNANVDTGTVMGLGYDSSGNGQVSVAGAMGSNNWGIWTQTFNSAFSNPAAANNRSLFGWDRNAWRTFFKTGVNPLPELREGGCGRAFLDAFSEGGLFPDGGPGTEPDSLIKQAGTIAAAQYAVNQGLVVPLRSSIYRGILEGTETAASGAVVADIYTREAQGFTAEYSAFNAGACH